MFSLEFAVDYQIWIGHVIKDGLGNFLLPGPCAKSIVDMKSEYEDHARERMKYKFDTASRGILCSLP
jgi:hypothetical protein